jgi:flagellar motility protein MotE (MotC chaperone)
MINPAHNESTRFRSLVGAAIIILLMTSSALAQDKTPSEVPTKDAKERPIVDTRGCDLSPAEQIVVTQLRKAIENVEARRLRLASLETALITLQEQINDDMAKLRQLQKDIASTLDKREQKKVDDRNKRIVQLANLLRKMRPENAANIIAVTEDKLAIATLDRLGERQASKLLEALPAARAVQLANKLLDLPFTKKEKK